MEKLGIVVKLNDGYATVCSIREAACGSCENCKSKCAESVEHDVEVLNTIDAKVGDKVRIEIDGKSVISYVFLVYGLPLIFFLASVTISFSIFEKMNFKNYQLLSFIVGVIFTAVSFIIIKKIDNKNTSVSGIVMKRYEI